MSVETCPKNAMPTCVDDVILPRAHDLGGFEVRRALPATQRQMVGPFIFFDQMGPGEFLTGRGLDVRPHPHIGLSTITYLFDGAIQHRDSLGTDLSIDPGDVNWMTAGRGITHSERTAAEARRHPNRLFGIQSWVALPRTHEGDRSRLRPPQRGRTAGGGGSRAAAAVDCWARLGAAGACAYSVRPFLR